MIADLILANRSCRRFDQQHHIETKCLLELVELARLSASAANLQPLRYIVSNSRHTNAQIFNCLKWAGYLKNWNGPEEGERPSAYIAILNDTRISLKVDCDHGIAAQSILLGAREQGLGGCMIGAVNRPKLSSTLNISEYYKILLVLAIGKPTEEVVIDTMGADGNIEYWRSEDQIHHVPKRSLEDIVIKCYES